MLYWETPGIVKPELGIMKLEGSTVSVRTKPISPLKAMKRKEMLYQTVQEEIKAHILENGLKAGDALPPETELAIQLDISRNSVREAVKALEALGIVESRPGTGLFVREFNFDSIVNNLAYGTLFELQQISNVLEVRLHLEAGMVERVIEKLTPEQIQRLRAILDQMRDAAVEGHYSEEADRAFHRCLYDNVNNPLLWNILDVFWNVLRLAQKYEAMPGPTNPMDSYRVHIPIVDALEKRDVEGMRAALRHHYGGIEARLRRFEEARAQKSEPITQ
ncbi:MAG: FadR/GntR family transcriptional regulator [Aggregatilineales bacterium]